MDSKRLCNDVIQTQIDLVVYVTTFPAYIFLKTFIQSLLTFRYLLSGVNFTYGVSVLTSLSFSLTILECSFIVSLTSVYPQHQRRNISFSPHLSISQCLCLCIYNQSSASPSQMSLLTAKLRSNQPCKIITCK